MASIIRLDSCSTCQKSSGRCMCGGCKAFFCIKHFEQHRQGLSMRFDDEIVRAHDELLDKISKVDRISQTTTEVFNDIDHWETSIINKIHQTAERVRQHLTQLITEKGAELTKDIGGITKEIRDRREELDFDENDIEILRQKLHHIQLKLDQVIRPVGKKKIVIADDQIDWNRLIYIAIEENRFATSHLSLTQLDSNSKWIQNATTIAGGNGQGSEISQLSGPFGSYVNDDGTIYIVDQGNQRIVEWKPGAIVGRIVAGGNGQGNEDNQLSQPRNLVIDKQRDCLIISDAGNKRVVRWRRRNGIRGEVIISDIDCRGLDIDKDGFLYVVDCQGHEVRRYGMNGDRGIVVAGGNGKGDRLDQLSYPYSVFVDQDKSVYVSDSLNHRVMKWEVGTKQGTIVAGGQRQGSSLRQLSNPQGIFVDQSGTVYVTDQGNHRILRWPKGSLQGYLIAGGNDQGNRPNQLSNPISLSFDRHGNFYVSDYFNHRVQKFNIDPNP